MKSIGQSFLIEGLMEPGKKDERNNDIRKRVRIKIEEMLKTNTVTVWDWKKRSGTGQNYNKV